MTAGTPSLRKINDALGTAAGLVAIIVYQFAGKGTARKRWYSAGR
jgi:hypothetical protein